MARKINPGAYDIYQLGIWIAQLEALAQPPSYWSSVITCLEALCRFKYMQGLESIGDDAEHDKNNYSREYDDYEKPIKSVHSHLLRLRSREWRGRLEEVSKGWVLCCPQAHMDISKLRKGAKSFLTDEEWQILTPLEQEGLNEASSCLLFNNFTSAEFMALRTVESLLRRWYEKDTGKVMQKATFGQVLDRLDREFPEPNRPEEISPLYHLKRRRNDIAHPEVISNEEDATVTFLHVIRECKALKTKLLS